MKQDNLAKAKAGLILDQPFFASILLSMPFIADETIPTFATNGDEIRYNPKFLDSLTLPEVTFVLAHETMHCVFQHMLRIGTKDHKKWNVATDYVINDLLITERIGSMPKGGLHNADLVLKGEGTAEGVYKLLPDETESEKKSGKGPKGGYPGGGQPLDDISQPSQDEAVLTQKSAEMKVKVIQAQNAAKMQGKLSGGIERLVKEITKSTTDWRAVLRRFLSERAKIDLSYAKPKRRFLADDIYLPSQTGEKLGQIVIAIDCSGSIQPAMLDMFQGEVQSVLSEAMPSEIKVIYFDTEVLKTEVFTNETEEVKLSPVGGGGTAFSPIFAHLDSQETLPIACIVLTDLYCDDFGPMPDYPVLWACTSRRTDVPFGEVTQIKDLE